MINGKGNLKDMYPNLDKDKVLRYEDVIIYKFNE